MYEAFYGLHEKPFNLTPDPRFLYLSIKHKEAFAHLFYGIRSRSGFVMVSGEIGTGKTTICRSLLKQLDAGTEVAFIFNPKLSPEELLRTINADFGIPSQADTVRGLIDELNKFLLKSSAEDKNCVLVIDEAQNLSTETLEQVRLLSNLETETEKLLQIVLIGQPELADKLALSELRQLDQRITARYHLEPLDRKETLEYIAFRLSIAGGRKRVRFTRGAVRRVHKISGGTPRVINAICDRALLIGFTKEAPQITARLVKQAAKEVQGDRRIREIKLNFGRVLPASAFVLTSLVAVLALVLLTSGPLPSLDDINLFTQGRTRQPVVADAPRADTDPALQSVSDPGVAEVFPRVPVSGAPREGQDAGSDRELSATSPNRLQAPSNIAEAASRPATEDLPPHEAEPGDLLVSRRVDNAGTPPDTRRIADLGARAPIQNRQDETNMALSTMLQAWNLAVLSDLPATNSLQDMRRFAIKNGLSFVRLSITVEQIAMINLPVLVRLNVDSRDSWTAVVGIEGDNRRVVVSSRGSDTLLMGAFREMYTGEAVYLWADPEAGAEVIRIRSDGPAVRGLQYGLRSLGLMDGDATGVYDAGTIEVIMRIQRASGLPVDGIVGPQTRMVLASWLPDHPTPSLTTPSFSDTARASVFASRAAGETRTSLNVLERLEGPNSAGPASIESPLPDPSSIVDTDPIQEAGEAIGEATQAADPGVETITNADAAEFQDQQDDSQNGEEPARVEAEPLDLPEYRPQLEVQKPSADNRVTPSAGPIVPIVPSEDRGGVQL